MEEEQKKSSVMVNEILRRLENSHMHLDLKRSLQVSRKRLNCCLSYLNWYLIFTIQDRTF